VKTRPGKSEVKAVILALHGFNDYANAFDGPGEIWAKEGIVTYAYDQRGFGAAPERGLWPGHWRPTPRPPRKYCAGFIPEYRSICSAKAWAVRWQWSH